MNVNDARSRLRKPLSPRAQSATSHTAARPIKRLWYTRILSAATFISRKLSSIIQPRPLSRIIAPLRKIPRSIRLASFRTALSRTWAQLIARKKFVIIASVICVFAVWFIRQPQPAVPTSTKTNGTHSSSQPAALPKETPPFPALLPIGKSANDLGGWTRISPTNNDATYAYVDHIGSTQINVSQQVLPKSFRDNIDDSIRTLAESFDARETIRAGDITVYIGTSVKGPQSIIFTKNNLLILIKSSGKIAEPLWQNYIKDLD